MRCPNCAAPVTGDELVVADPAGWWDRYCAGLNPDQLRDLVAGTVDRLAAAKARCDTEVRREKMRAARLEVELDRARLRIHVLNGGSVESQPVELVVVDAAVDDWSTVTVARVDRSSNPWRLVTAEGAEVWEDQATAAGQRFSGPIGFDLKRDAVAELARRRAGQGELPGEAG